jgi:cell division protein FtsL
MVRVLNVFCVALMGLSILALYHVSEKTRVAHMTLTKVNRQIAQEKSHLSVLETEWQHVASPARIQKLAQARLGMGDTVSVQLSSFDQLPRRGVEPAPLNNAPVHNASAQIPANARPPVPILLASDSGM